MKLKQNGKRVKWSAEDIVQAMTLHRISPKEYKYLRDTLNYPLPAKSTFKKWAKKVNCEPGLLTEVLLAMKKNLPTLNHNENLVCLSFDEMKVSEKVSYDPNIDQVIGPHKMVQVVMARSIVGNWKQPIYYNFDQSMTVDLFQNIVSALYRSGYIVVSVVSDLGGSNRGFLKTLGITEEKTLISHPNDKNLKIFFFADVPHLLKLARNHLVDKGFIVNGVHIDVNPIQELLTLQTEVTVAHRLSSAHICVTGTARQKVKLAAQLFSNSVSMALKYLGDNGLLKSSNWEECSSLLKLFNDWFDLFNVRAKQIDSRDTKKAFGCSIHKQREIIESMSNLIESMHVQGHKSLLPFQKGIILSNNSLLGFYEFLTSKFNMKYILTYRLNQDVLENFFSHIRAIGRTYDHPNSLEFKYRMKSLILSKNS